MISRCFFYLFLGGVEVGRVGHVRPVGRVGPVRLKVSVERGVGAYFAISARKFRKVEPSSIDGV